MFDLDALLSLSIVLLGIVGWAAFFRLVPDREPVNLAALFGRQWELAWPRGVQEEEPARWRTELAQRPGRRAVTPLAARPATVSSPEAAPSASPPLECMEDAAA